jgi:23S rRNA (cytidine1920-2'-O)/16S rRNA (cytidine1409-2'-O)-methyltransferase
MARLDKELVARGLAPTRARARDAVLRGHVTIDGRQADRPGVEVRASQAIVVSDPAAGYVSRAALKLIHALDHFGYDPTGRRALDIGASTGGFTQVLLRRGATEVVAIDVGHGQLAPALAADPRVKNREGVNARALTAEEAGGPVGAVVSDVSFISQRLVLPPALDLAEPGAFAVVLAKPQFEVGRDALGRGGLVRDPIVAEQSALALRDWLAARPGWAVDGLVPSPISGGDGNREFLLGARRS